MDTVTCTAYHTGEKHFTATLHTGQKPSTVDHTGELFTAAKQTYWGEATDHTGKLVSMTYHTGKDVLLWLKLGRNLLL